MTPEGSRPPLSFFEQYPRTKEIRPDGYPKHILIIPDGNRRDAKLQGENPLEGHYRGTKVLLKVMRDLRQLPIDFVTLWGFSADNTKRPADEV